MTAGLLAEELERQGFNLVRSVDAGLPLAVWSVDLELERIREVSAAELAVLQFVTSGISDIGVMAELLGLGSDRRLAEAVLVKLLDAGAIDRLGEGFNTTEVGRAWQAARSARGRERVTFDVRLDPVEDRFEWTDHERPLFATPETWTIELTRVDDEVLLRQKPRLAALVRDGVLPDEVELRPQERRPLGELRGFAIVDRKQHWRHVRLDFWKHPRSGIERVLGYIADAEHPALTKLIERHTVYEARRWLAPPA